MLVVILIIGLLATLVLVNVVKHGEDAALKITRAQIAQLRGQIDVFRLQRGRTPDRLEDLVRAGYLDELPVDGWNHAFVYRVPGPEGRPFEILSLGPDGVEGTPDDLSSRPKT